MLMLADVFDVKLRCGYVTVLIGYQGDEVTVLTNKEAGAIVENRPAMRRLF